MIIRVVAIDPHPRPGTVDDTVVYQVPENSRAYELLTDLLEKAGIEWITLGTVKSLDFTKGDAT